MSKMSKIDQIHLRAVMRCKNRSNTPKGCNAMYVEDVKDGKRTYRHIFYHTFLNMVSFECNAMYVEDVEDGKRTYTHILVHNLLNI